MLNKYKQINQASIPSTFVPALALPDFSKSSVIQTVLENENNLITSFDNLSFSVKQKPILLQTNTFSKKVKNEKVKKAKIKNITVTENFKNIFKKRKMNKNFSTFKSFRFLFFSKIDRINFFLKRFQKKKVNSSVFLKNYKAQLLFFFFLWKKKKNISYDGHRKIKVGLFALV